MKLREITESRETVGLIFGRFNPPHKGHVVAWNMASENDHWYVGTNESTNGPKDPLPYDIKVEIMEAMCPEVKGHVVPHKTWLTLASEIYESHGNVTLKVYTDEAWVLETLNKYNGVKKDGGHGYYNFKDIVQVETPRLSSATALREAVSRNDKAAFSEAAGIEADTEIGNIPYFEIVAHHLDVELDEATRDEVIAKITKGQKNRMLQKVLAYMHELVSKDPSKNVGAAAFQIGREYNLSGIGLTPRELKHMYMNFSGMKEAMPPAEKKVDVFYKGKQVKTLELPARPQPHHVSIMLKKMLPNVKMNDLERQALARDIAQGKEANFGDLHFAGQKDRRPRVMT